MNIYERRDQLALGVVEAMEIMRIIQKFDLISSDDSEVLRKRIDDYVTHWEKN